MAVKIIEGAKAINAAVSKNGTMVSSLKEHVHSICVSAALHHAKHGDTTIIATAINKVCEQMEHAAHNNAVRAWFDEYACLTWSSTKKQFVHNKDKVAEANKDLEAYTNKLLASKPYYELRKPTPFTPVNLMGTVISAINRFAKFSDEEKADPRNKIEGMDELINVVKKHGMGDKLAIAGEPLVETGAAFTRAA